MVGSNNASEVPETLRLNFPCFGGGRQRAAWGTASPSEVAGPFHRGTPRVVSEGGQAQGRCSRLSAVRGGLASQCLQNPNRHNHEARALPLLDLACLSFSSASHSKFSRRASLRMLLRGSHVASWAL